MRSVVGPTGMQAPSYGISILYCTYVDNKIVYSEKTE